MIEQLAIFGGEPTFEKPLHVGRPNLAPTRDILDVFAGILECKWLTNNGGWVHRLEADIKRYLDVKHCVVVANGTLGLEIAARALMPEHGEVIVPSFTFVATPNALAWQGYKPVFADINPKTHVLDPVDLEARITDDTVGILGVHTWGTPCEIEALTAIAVRHKLPLFFDAAHAFGCKYRGQSIGNFGRCEVFSFHATKFFNTAEGGAITTNDDQLAKKLRELRNFGFIGDGSQTTTGVGINAKMSELHAAVGVLNLTEIKTFVDRNQINYCRYWYNLWHTGAHVYSHESQTTYRSNFQYVVVELDGLSADTLVKVLHAENILARRYFSPPCHKVAPYNQEGYYLPVTKAVSNRVIVLPTGMAVMRQDVDKICELILYCVEHGDEISKELDDAN